MSSSGIQSSCAVGDSSVVKNTSPTYAGNGQPSLSELAERRDCDVSHPVESVSSGKVGFKTGKDRDTSRNEREKYLTARYPKNQMSMIRRRLAVEDWIDVELKKLYDLSDDDYGTYDAVIEVDELLDLDSAAERAEHIQEQILDVQKPKPVIDRFVSELLEKLDTL